MQATLYSFARYILTIDFGRLSVPVIIFTFGMTGLITFLIRREHSGRRNPVRMFLAHCFPWVYWKAASTRVDIILYFMSRFTQKWISVFSASIIVYGATITARCLSQLMDFGDKFTATPIVVGLLSLLMFIFADLGEYLSHLTQHKIKFLWEFHKVHHSALFLTPFTTYRFHPVGNLLDGIFVGALLAIPASLAQLFYGFTFVELMAMNGGATLLFSYLLLSTLQHSHFQISFGFLDRIFISPQMHQVHHSVKHEHWGKNLGGRLSIWDWILGTAVILPKGEVLKFGMGTIEDERGDYSSVWRCYVGPLIACNRMARQMVALKLGKKKADSKLATN